MNDLRESHRHRLQKELDAEKSLKDRNILGQYSTPYDLALEMIQYAEAYLPVTPVSFLEPAFGTGVFFSALLDTVPFEKACGVEIDAHYYGPSSQFWAEENINLINDDFLALPARQEFDLIVTNPPYSRHHHINADVKRKLQAQIHRYYGISLSGLAGLYCYFLILSTRWLREDGLSMWLIPSEFLDVKYGEGLKRFLTECVDLISIHRFNPEEVQFSDALVSSAIVTFRNTTPRKEGVWLSSGGSLLNPVRKEKRRHEELKPDLKWSKLFNEDVEEIEGRMLGEYFHVKRGVSTGNNSFFILSRQKVEDLDIPERFLTPVLPSPRCLKETIVKNGDEKEVDREELFLLSCKLPKDILHDKFPGLYSYIETGEAEGIDKTYNAQRRVPWYACEVRPPAPFYMTYMGRGEKNDRLFRFILNDSKAIVTNSYLMLYPRDEYRYCFGDVKVRKKVWEVLNGIPKDRLMRCGRTYGGGLYKIEPKELEKVMIPELDRLLYPQQLSLF